MTSSSRDSSSRSLFLRASSSCSARRVSRACSQNRSRSSNAFLSRSAASCSSCSLRRIRSCSSGSLARACSSSRSLIASSLLISFLFSLLRAFLFSFLPWTTPTWGPATSGAPPSITTDILLRSEMETGPQRPLSTWLKERNCRPSTTRVQQEASG